MIHGQKNIRSCLSYLIFSRYYSIILRKYEIHHTV